MITIYKTVKSDKQSMQGGNMRRIPKGVVFSARDSGFSDGAFYYQSGFKRRRAFDWVSCKCYGGYRLYKMRGGWYCAEKSEYVDCGGTFPVRYEITKAEAGAIKATCGGAFEKIYNVCKENAV